MSQTRCSHEFYLWWRFGDDLLDPEFYGDEFQDRHIDRLMTFIVDTNGQCPVSVEFEEPDDHPIEPDENELEAAIAADNRPFDQLRPIAETKAMATYRKALQNVTIKTIDTELAYLRELKRAGIGIRQLKAALEAELKDRTQPCEYKRNELLSLSNVSDDQIKEEIQELESLIDSKLDLNDRAWCFWQERSERRRANVDWKEQGF